VFCWFLLLAGRGSCLFQKGKSVNLAYHVEISTRLCKTVFKTSSLQHSSSPGTVK